jgi:hypothetical protein
MTKSTVHGSLGHKGDRERAGIGPPTILPPGDRNGMTFAGQSAENVGRSMAL